MNDFLFWLISLALLGFTSAVVFQHEIYRRENLKARLMREGILKYIVLTREIQNFSELLREYNAYEGHKLHGKFSDFKSVSQNIGNFEGYDYYINITIGTPQQSFGVLLNTTSGSLVIPDINCSNCTNVKKFDPSKSSTYQKTNQYLNNNSSYGIYGQDFIRVGVSGRDQLVIPNSMFGQTLIPTEIVGFDGVMGLGFTAENPDGVDSPIITAVKSGILDYPVVTLFFRHIPLYNSTTNGGVITYGAVDTVNCDRNIVYEPLANPNKFEISIKGASLGSSQFSGNWSALIDSTYFSIVTPSYISDAFAKEVNATAKSGLYFVDCNVKFNVQITIGTTAYTLTEKTMVVNAGSFGCYLALYTNNDEAWVLGIPWIESFCNVLDYGNKRVGFATPTTSRN